MIKTFVAKFSAWRSLPVNAALNTVDEQDLKKNAELIRDSGIFDADFYLGQLNDSFLSPSEAILHYLRIGAKNNLQPHPLFDTSFYIETNKDVNFDLYNPLLHFITIGGREGRNPHPLFDAEFYINEYIDVRRSTMNPLAHYIHFGAAEGRMPSMVFDNARYKRKAQEADLRDALIPYFVAHQGNHKRNRHLLRYRAKAVLTRNAGNKWKSMQAVLQRRQNLLMYFLSQGAKKRVFPFPSFELLYKLESVGQATDSLNISGGRTAKYWRVMPRRPKDYQLLPGEFLRFGQQVAKANLSKEKYALYKELVQSLTLKKNAPGFMESKNTIILCSHVASLTGAPLLLLHIARSLSTKGWECLLFLDREGELENEFNEVAHIINFHGVMGREYKCEQYLSLLFDDLPFKRPKISILNSLETGKYVKAMARSGIKIISLVHEFVDTYTMSFLSDVFEISDLSIFPAKFVSDFAQKRAGSAVNSGRHMIMPNPLLDASFGQYNKTEACKRLRNEIGASDDSLIILGCGAPEMRKGLDLFVFIARSVMSKWQQQSEKSFRRPIHFVWVGAEYITPFSQQYYVDWDLKQGNLASYIHLLPARKDLRPVFHGADIFVIPSRKDSFPCVGHDAMAAQLPIVSFENAGGVPEMVEGGGAKIIPYGDIIKFAEAVYGYLTNEPERLEAGRLNARLVLERFCFSDYISKLEREINTIIER